VTPLAIGIQDSARARGKVQCISTPVPCMSQIPRLSRHQPPPRTHCCASLSTGVVVGEGILEPHPARHHSVAAIPTIPRTMDHRSSIARIPWRAGALVVGDRAAREKVSRPAGPGSRWRRISSLRPDRSRELSPWDRMMGEARIDGGDHRVTASGLPRTRRYSWRPPRRAGFQRGGSAIAYMPLRSWFDPLPRHPMR
jgi:hypothetical protein